MHVNKTANSILVHGVYSANERLTVLKSGEGVGAELHIKADGKQVMKGFHVNADYVIIDGFDVTGHTARYTGLIQLAKRVSNIVIRNNRMRDSATDVYGLYSYDGTYAIADYPRHVTVTGNTMTNTKSHMLSFQCDNCAISIFGPSTTGVDAVRFFGRDSIISHNESLMSQGYSNRFNWLSSSMVSVS